MASGNSMSIDFVLIQAGTYLMGSRPDEAGRFEDENIHQVTIFKPFYLQATTVTKGQWDAVMKGDSKAEETLARKPVSPKRHKSKRQRHETLLVPDLKKPVVSVSWFDCQEFIKRLNSMDGTDKYRLPIESEWEYACRAGTTTRFFWGDKADCSRANFGVSMFTDECRGVNPGRIIEAGQYSPNAWGLFDMHGNIWEWCQDWWNKEYPSGAVIDPSGPSSGTERVRRGGGWNIESRFSRSANRAGSNPNNRLGDIGFRLAKDI